MSRQIQRLVNKYPNILKLFNELNYSRGNWEVWNDFITLTALSIANSVELCTERKNAREKDFNNIYSKYSDKEKQTMAEIFAEIVKSLEANPNQDLLGELYMSLDFGSSELGQFFTPYSVCEMMAKVSIDKKYIEEEINDKGYIRINEPSCGAGANIIALANELKSREINYQTSAYFVAQDLSQLTALMCYIQMSLLGMAGIVVVGDTLCKPYTKENYDKSTSLNVWETPMAKRDIWILRSKI